MTRTACGGLDLVRERLGSRVQRADGKGGFWARSPLREDKDASLRVWQADDGWVCFKDFGGATRDEILSALGLTLADIGPPRDWTPPTASARATKQPAVDVLGVWERAVAVARRQLEAGRGRAIAYAGERLGADAADAAIRSGRLALANDEVHRLARLRWQGEESIAVPCFDLATGSIADVQFRLAREPAVGKDGRFRRVKGAGAGEDICFGGPVALIESVGSTLVVCGGHCDYLVATAAGHAAIGLVGETSGAAVGRAVGDWIRALVADGGGCPSTIVLATDLSSTEDPVLGEKHCAHLDFARALGLLPCELRRFLVPQPPTATMRRDLADLWLSDPDAVRNLVAAATPMLVEAEDVEDQGPTAEEDETSGLEEDGDDTLEEAAGWVPFPLATLPGAVGQFVEEAANAIGCDVANVALPVLAVLAAAIGNSRAVRVKRSWHEPSIIWTLLVLESGALKSPAIEHAIRPIIRRQEQARAEYARQHREWFEGLGGDKPDPSNPAPILARCHVEDITIEALAGRLADNPRGVLLARDELSGWLRSFDQYRGGRGGDVQHYLNLFGARSITIDRKTGALPALYVARPHVSITGGVQPDALAGALSREYRDCGLAARILMARPPRRARRWTEADLDERTERDYHTVVENLFTLEPELDRDGEPRPVLLSLDAAAKDAFITFFNEHGLEQAQLDGDLCAAWSKLEGYALRFALVLHCAMWADLLDGKVPGPIGLQSMTAGIELAQWFAGEARRLYSTFVESAGDRDLRELEFLVREAGSEMTARELMRKSRRYRGSVAIAEAALDRLVRAHRGRWKLVPPTRNGGRSTRVLVLK